MLLQFRQTLVSAKQVAQIPTNGYIPDPFPGTCPTELLQGAPNCSSLSSAARGDSSAFACTVFVLGRSFLHPSQQGGVSPSPPVNDERFIYSGTNYSGSLAYLGKLPIHHRRVEFSRHECLFYEHLHSMNAQSKKFINMRIVHTGSTLYS